MDYDIKGKDRKGQVIFNKFYFLLGFVLGIIVGDLFIKFESFFMKQISFLF